MPRLPSLLALATFLPLLILPGLYHCLFSLRSADLKRWYTFLQTHPPDQALRAIDDDFDRRFLLRFVATALTEKLPAVQSRLRDVDVQVGTHGFLFATEDTRVCTAAGFLHPAYPRPRQAADQIIAFDRYLKSHGVHLLVLPVPAKASIYPDRLDPHYDPAAGPLLNVDHHAWFDLLRSANVDTLDLTDLFWSRRFDPGQDPLFYPNDTHWTDRAKSLAAAAIASHLAPRTSNLPPATPHRQRPFTQHVQGNLHEPDAPTRSSPAFVEHLTQLVYDDDSISATTSPSPTNAPNPAPPSPQLGTDNWERTTHLAFPHAPILLLGDSQASIGSESRTGLQQRLIQSLHTDVASLAEAGFGPNPMRLALTTHPTALRHKRIVIWAFSIRHLLIKPWDPIPH